ncbi:peptidoglycan recognition family protein [Streptomyces sp. ME02-6979.5a]|uniref:N-acetylmuramoyl-L-alanine amidase n=1 Tax=Streptomyces sp. ME02-6979.5a TaxID=462925 RepID=UPI0029A4E784|nr:peptidoglycan recognition family protein [Streptomyces sp. ME02-6979.5a]MDX3343493.1 peptidoglycan recognition family protein [Streptomyces sp. ME02-6979.5a]
MATPLTADRLLKALRGEGLKVVEHRSWRTHNRNHKGLWGPVHGVMIHHTVSSGDDSSVALCYNGHSALPGPLCHGVGRNDGTVALVSAGRANHAGSGDDDVLRAVINETALPAPNEANTDGNRHFYGLEIINLGDNKDTYTKAQYRAAVLWAAALCRAHGWSERSVIGHKEWQPGKIDPRGPIEGGGSFSMTQFRADVRDQLVRKPGTSTPPVTPPKEAEDTMTPAQEALLKQVAADLGSVKKDVAELKKNATLAPWTYKNAALVAEAKKTGSKVPDMHGRIEHIEQMLTTLTKES